MPNRIDQSGLILINCHSSFSRRENSETNIPRWLQNSIRDPVETRPKKKKKFTPCLVLGSWTAPPFNWKTKFTSVDETATRREAPFLPPQISPQWRKWRDEEEARGGCYTGYCTYEDEWWVVAWFTSSIAFYSIKLLEPIS